MSYGQSGTELMLDGGFEFLDLSIPIQAPYPSGTSPIYRAPPWDNVHNTCDVHNSSYVTPVIGSPHSGTGCGRFVAPMTGAAGGNEFCSGETDPLVAGQIYIVSFWVRKDFSEDREVPIGIVASESIPSIQTSPSFNSSHISNYTITPLSTQYVHGSFCFTAQNSVKHYISFGPWIPDGGSVTLGFYLDDVSVKALDAGTPVPTVNLSIAQNSYCIGDNVMVDGSNTSGGNGHILDIYEIVNANQESFVYSTGLILGQPSTFDVTSVINPSPGDCYRVYLTSTSICSGSDFVDFCFVDPEIDFINNGDPVCEGVPIDLTVTGDNGWVYTWSQGGTPIPNGSGQGLKILNVTPTQGNSTYTVTVLTPEGCTSTETFTFTVHSQNNIAPWLGSINGSGDYTIYVNAGNAVNFTVNTGNDNSNENVQLQQLNGVLGSITFTNNGQSSPTLNYFWQTSTTTSGEYSIQVSATDDNVCGFESGTFTYTIIVICDHCPLCIYYEDRTPSSIPLPAETKAGKCIEAGLSEDVETGTANVLFQAGEYILTGPFWSAGDGYQGMIDPTTCVSDCENCCNNLTGFTFDPIPVYSLIDLFDSDPTNDVFQITDINHPYCAYNATGFTFTVFQNTAGGSNNQLFNQEFQNMPCCSFSSPSPDNPIAHASIWWNGTLDGAGQYVYWGYHEFLLGMYDCNGDLQNILTQDHYIYTATENGRLANSNDSIFDHQNEVGNEGEAITTIREERVLLENKIRVSPNPSMDFVTLNGLEDYANVQYQLFDEQGRAISNRINAMENSTINVQSLTAGIYYIRVYVNDNYALKKFIKQ